MANVDTTSRGEVSRIDAQLAGLDALELALPPRARIVARVWPQLWPKALAIGMIVGLWQIVVWTGWKPDYVLPGPAKVFPVLFDNFGDLVDAAGITLGRAAQGFGLAIDIGGGLGALVA